MCVKYKMDLSCQAEMYVPSVDEHGNYIDKIPPIRNGIRCPCGSRKEKIYETHGIFSTHIKSKTHKNWLIQMNDNRANHYIENEELKLTIQNQQRIIAKMEKEIQNKSMTIDYLTHQLTIKNDQVVVSNLIDL